MRDEFGLCIEQNVKIAENVWGNGENSTNKNEHKKDGNLNI